VLVSVFFVLALFAAGVFIGNTLATDPAPAGGTTTIVRTVTVTTDAAHTTTVALPPLPPQ
jgi:energy-converting hydrogenase Eha subunit B